jgi:hypothetical protein
MRIILFYVVTYVPVIENYGVVTKCVYVGESFLD